MLGAHVKGQASSSAKPQADYKQNILCCKRLRPAGKKKKIHKYDKELLVLIWCSRFKYHVLSWPFVEDKRMFKKKKKETTTTSTGSLKRFHRVSMSRTLQRYAANVADAQHASVHICSTWNKCLVMNPFKPEPARRFHPLLQTVSTSGSLRKVLSWGILCPPRPDVKGHPLTTTVDIKMSMSSAVWGFLLLPFLSFFF